MFRYIFFLPIVWQEFLFFFLSWMNVEFCEMLSLHLLRWSCGSVFSFDVVYHSDWSETIEKSFYPLDKSHLIMVYEPCIVVYECLVFVEDICHLCSSVILASTFHFCSIFIWFWYQGNGDLIEWNWEFSFLCNFWKCFRRIAVSASINLW